MTAPSRTDSAERAPDAASSRFWRQRRPAPRAHPFFRFVFPALLALAGVSIFVLWRDGAKAVLELKEGTEVTDVRDPAAPGYRAFAKPTPTLLIAHVDEADSLIGVTVLARTSLDDGGNLVILSPDMVLELADGGVILDQIYATEGIKAVEAAVAEFFGFGFTENEPAVMGEEQLAAQLRLVEPVSFSLTDDLTRVNDGGEVEVVHESGFGRFTADDLAEIYAWRNPGELDDGRFTRQLDIWRAWLTAIREADDLTKATLPFDEGLPPYLRALATGTADLEFAPVVSIAFGGADPLYALPDGLETWPEVKGREMVPLPVSYAPGVWPKVQLLDGTGEPEARGRLLPKIVAAGAEITVIGNSSAFGVKETFVAYHSADDATRAEALAESLGVPVVFEERLNEPGELTVTVGLDSADL